MWSPTASEDAEDEQLPKILAGKTELYTFNNNDLITAFNNNPNIANLRNDFSVWGERTTISGAKVPVHLRYAIDDKPVKYTSISVTNEEVDEYNRKYNTKLKSQGDYSDPDVETNPVYTYVAGEKYSIKNGTVTCDWREIIYQMAKDYYRYNFLDDFELRVAATNPEYPLGRTGYESYYQDMEGFWRELYYPVLAEEYTEIKNEYDKLTSEEETLKTKLYGVEVDWATNNLGGLENDVSILNNLLSDERYDDARKVITYWNTKPASPDIPTDVYINQNETFTPPKYELYDSKNDVITDPDVYLGMLQDHYFREKNNLSIIQTKLSEVTAKKEKLESNIRENFYVAKQKFTNEKGEEVTIGIDKDSPLLYWNKNIYESPYLLNFWFDFIDGTGLEKCSVKNVGNRPKAIQDSSVKSIYFRDVPEVLYINSEEDYDLIEMSNSWHYTRIQNLPMSLFNISA
jgi:hypothetical protein